MKISSVIFLIGIIISISINLIEGILFLLLILILTSTSTSSLIIIIYYYYHYYYHCNKAQGRQGDYAEYVPGGRLARRRY